MTRLPMTAAGHVALEDELRNRTRIARPSLVQRIRQAISDARREGFIGDSEARQIKRRVEEHLKYIRAAHSQIEPVLT